MRISLVLLSLAAAPLAGQNPSVSAVRYDLRFDRSTAAQHTLDVIMTFEAAGAGESGQRFAVLPHSVQRRGRVIVRPSATS